MTFPPEAVNCRNRRPPVPVDYGGVGEALGPFPPGLNTEGLAPGRGLSVFDLRAPSARLQPVTERAPAVRIRDLHKRYGVLGVADASPWLSFLISIGLAAILFGWTVHQVGYRLKS